MTQQRRDSTACRLRMKLVQHGLDGRSAEVNYPISKN